MILVAISSCRPRSAYSVLVAEVDIERLAHPFESLAIGPERSRPEALWKL